MVPPVFVHCGFGLLLTLASVPLVLRRVPMNGAYGIRIEEAFRSEADWYAVNAFGGRLFLIYGVLLTVFGFAARNHAPAATSPWSPVFIVGPLLVTLVLLPPIKGFARRRAAPPPPAGTVR